MLKSNLKYIVKNNYWLQILSLKIKYFFSNKYYEIDFSIIKNKRFRTYVDIGAYRGEYINFLKTRSKKIIAFEPIKRNFNLLNNFHSLLFFLPTVEKYQRGEKILFVKKKHTQRCRIYIRRILATSCNKTTAAF